LSISASVLPTKVVQSLGDKLERTFMTTQRVLWPNDFEAAVNEVEPLVAEFTRLAWRDRRNRDTVTVSCFFYLVTMR
jgi:hypothetical protein